MGTIIFGLHSGFYVLALNVFCRPTELNVYVMIDQDECASNTLDSFVVVGVVVVFFPFQSVTFQRPTANVFPHFFVPPFFTLYLTWIVTCISFCALCYLLVLQGILFFFFFCCSVWLWIEEAPRVIHKPIVFHLLLLLLCYFHFSLSPSLSISLSLSRFQWSEEFSLR